MPIPKSVEEFLNLPVFVVNLEVATQRFHTVAPRIQQAGFKNIYRYLGVHGANQSQKMAAYANLGNPRITQKDVWFLHSPGRQGCLFSHLLLWKQMIERNIPVAVVLEDDVCFHSRWDEILTDYIEQIPQDADLVYLGCQFRQKSTGKIVDKIECITTHAYVVTLEGAKILFDTLTNEPDGLSTLDEMIHYKVMKPGKINWVTFDSQYPEYEDPMVKQMPEDFQYRACGLIFQDPRFPTLIERY